MTTTALESRAPSRFKLYKELAKSGIVTLVLISVLGGYLAGSPLEKPIDVARLLWTLVGILALASGSSALNQIQDREIDASMPRTQKRPLPSGKMSLSEAWAFVGMSIAVGLAILWKLSPTLFGLGLVAIASYNGLYTLWWKRHWAFAAIPGAVPGALPILMGYAAASGSIWTLGGLYLFLILFFWQMPHFWVLAIRFTDDYSAGGVPTLPVKLGKPVTVSQITNWCLGYVGLATLAPPFLGVSGLYCVGAMAFSLKILWELRAFRREPESKRWLHFFLWVNFSLIFYVALVVLDRWNYHLLRAWWVR
jgi:protoheme IX farnesyltransferase